MTFVLTRWTCVASALTTALFGCTGAGPSASHGNGGSGSGSGAAGGASGATGGNAGSAMLAMSGGGAGSGAVGQGGAPSAGAASSNGGAAALGGAASGGTAGMSAGTSGMLSGGAAGAGGGSGGGAAVALSGLKIEPNPNSVLSCYVSWTTDAAATSTVQFGVGGYQWEISDATPVTEHKVLVIGMHAAQMYMVKAISGAASAEGTFTTGALPKTIPVGSVKIHDKARAQPGWTLMNIQMLDPGTMASGGVVIPNSTHPPEAVIFDEEGQPVWYYVDGSVPDIGGAVSTMLTDKGVLIGPSWNSQQTNGTPPREVDFGGNVVWECKHASCGAGKNVSHHAGKLSNGDYVIIEYIATSDGVQSPVFRELKADSTEVWSLDWAKLVPPPSGSRTDWCHGNAITIDIEKNEVYANCRWVGLLKTSYQNPTKQWLMPASCASQGLGDITYDGSQYTDSHDPEIHSDGSILFFDNGGWNTRCMKSEYHTRVVEYQVDEANKTAKLVWEWPGNFSVPDTFYTSKWYSPYWGDADRLANGNVLIAAGILDTAEHGRIVEVTKAEGEIVWELQLPILYGAYRADRIDPPLVHPVTP
ncbi:MAG TPA: aryl-sulfate sulfotransferase [Polyangiaceae bacterium]|nr:aryl-sulfate sulfotransferase [Polyangiaceae bacterium]